MSAVAGASIVITSPGTHVVVPAATVENVATVAPAAKLMYPIAVPFFFTVNWAEAVGEEVQDHSDPAKFCGSDTLRDNVTRATSWPPVSVPGMPPAMS